MADYTVTLSDTQDKAMQAIALSVQDWIDNAVKERARISGDEIVKTTVEYCLDNGVQVPATREEIVAYAFANGVVKTAADRQAEAEAAMAAQQAELAASQEGA